MPEIFHHALKINTESCIGCAHCMHVCPTEALRIRNGKAQLLPNRCIDCGECYRACPVGAVYVEQDDFDNIFNYKYRVALIPSVMLGQFPDDITPDKVYQALISIGFTHVIQVEDSVDYLIQKIEEYIHNENVPKPVISSFCPAVVRLIQVKFPSLVHNLMLVRPPLDFTTAYIRHKLIKEGADKEEIGTFSIIPCAAKISAIKSPVGEDRSEVTGAINMDFIYNRILREIRRKDMDPKIDIHYKPLPCRNQNWGLTGGEAEALNCRSLAIDGIDNVVEFLEKVENDEIKGVDFLELRCCDQSCAGGILAAGNRFLSAEYLRNGLVSLPTSKSMSPQILNDYKTATQGKLSLKPIEPRSMLSLDEDMATAMKKMERVNRMMCFLPGIDCGVCGAPSCRALAEDVVQGHAAISQCVFLQKNMEQYKLDPEHSFKIMKQVWGANRFKKNCDKPLDYK